MTKKIDGKYYNKTLSKNKCINCGQEFVTYVLLNGKWRSLHSRLKCLECLPYDCGKVSAQYNIKPKKCRSCNVSYYYNSYKGNTKSFCSKCYIRLSNLKKKKRSVRYKGGKCLICGYNKCYRSLCFHHIDPSKKEFTIGNFQALSWAKLKPELDKCVLLCMNCHGEVHEQLVKLEDYLK